MSSKIQWTDETWNPSVGCSDVSEGCRNCYARRIAWRLQHNPRLGERYAGTVRKSSTGALKWTGRVNLIPDLLEKPLRWKRPRRVFVDSQTDLFHPEVPDTYIAAVLGIIAACPDHTFQLLTKRPERLLQWMTSIAFGQPPEVTCAQAAKAFTDIDVELPQGGTGWPLPNLWLGVSIEDQQTADDRIPLLLQCPAAVRFVSYEPALSPVTFELGGDFELGTTYNALTGRFSGNDSVGPSLDWIIMGGESGDAARPFVTDWARSVRDECAEAGVAFFLKQLGRRPTCDLNSAQGWLNLKDSHGGDVDEWPLDLRVREFPS